MCSRAVLNGTCRFSIAGEVGKIRNDMNDRRRVVQLGPWQWATLHEQVSPLLKSFVRLEVWCIVG